MIITDKNGIDWLCLAKSWNGTAWEYVPEFMCHDGKWWEMNYAVDMSERLLYGKLNTDNIVSLRYRQRRKTVFPSMDPLPI